MSELQYQPIFDSSPSVLGRMASHTWDNDPKRLGFTLARYKFVSKMVSGLGRVLEVGCGDAWATSIVAAEVEHITAVDFDERFIEDASGRVPGNVSLVVADFVNDIVYPPDGLPTHFDAAYALDVLEHIRPQDEGPFLGHICSAIGRDGVFICGMPSLESQGYASELSVAGHVNCKTESELRETLRRYFRNVFLFGMNDETVHTGYGPMCHYRLAVCCGAKV